MKETTFMIASKVSVECPYCKVRQHGFIGDPRGETHNCDDCGEEYHIHADADIEMD